MQLTEEEIKAIDELVIQFKNVLPRMDYHLLDKTAYECAAICIKHSIDIYNQERIKAKALIEMLKKCEEYFKDMGDADYEDEKYKPNQEMSIAVEISLTISEYK